jgi:MGT family glycosyltransferase
MLPGVLIGAAAEGARTAGVAMTFVCVPDWGVPAMGMGLLPQNRFRAALLKLAATHQWAKGLPAVNHARALNGLEPIATPTGLIGSADRLLVLASHALDFPEFAPPEHVRLVGPRLEDPAWAGHWSPPPGNEPLVLVGLSSTWMDQVPLLQRIADALGRLPVRGVVTTGPAVAPETVSAPDNVTVVRTAPHGEVLRHAAVAVTHGGHGTVAKSLAAGVPLVCMPLGRDQPDVAARVVRAGAGVRLRHDAEVAQIADAVCGLLRDPSYKRAADNLAEAIAEERSEDRAVLELEALAGVPARELATRC